MRKLPPYQQIGYFGSLIVAVIWLLFRVFNLIDENSWVVYAGLTVAGAVLVAALTEAYLLYKDYRAGHLFLMRSASLVGLLLTVLALPYFLYQDASQGDGFDLSIPLLMPCIIFFALRQLYLVKIDGVTFYAKTAFGAPVEVPLFNITDVKSSEQTLEVTLDSGNAVKLSRYFFFSGQWAKLRDRLARL